MGSPKPLLPYRGTTFLDHLIGVLAPQCAPVVVVLGAASERIRAGIRGEAVFVENPDYRTGQTSSMQCGLRAIPPECDGVIFTLVDHPSVELSTISALIPATRSEGSPQPLVRIPRFQGERGHPIWLAREIFKEILALPADGAARDVIRAHRPQTEFLDVDDPGVLADIDDPRAYSELMSAQAHQR